MITLTRNVYPSFETIPLDDDTGFADGALEW